MYRVGFPQAFVDEGGDLHVGKAAYRYVAGDGETFAYAERNISAYQLEAEVRKGRLILSVDPEGALVSADAFGKARFTPVTLERFKALEMRTREGYGN